MSRGSTPEPAFGARVRAGTWIGAKYCVTETLGSGGMGQVVLVEHVDLPKRFALKLIRPDRWDATIEARFRREARALARVSSPRVAQVTDFGVDELLGPFFVMEYAEGATLAELIRSEGPFDAGRALELAIGLAEALRDVHAAGIVHRDIKPANVSIGSGPVEVRLMDFGLAAALDHDSESRITQSRAVVGSMPYMAPEQFNGSAPSQQMDLWALGVVLFEMLHGRLPFDADSTAALMHKILTQEVPPTPRTGPALEPVFARLLAKDAADRVASADEAIELLEAAAAAPRSQWESSPSGDTAEAIRVDHRSSASTTRSVPTARPWAAVGVGAVVLVIGLAALGWQLGRGPGEPVAVSLAEDPPVEATVAVEVAEPAIEDEQSAEAEPVRPAEVATPRVRRRGARVAEPPPASATVADPAEPEAIETPEEAPRWTGGIIESPSE